MAVRRVCDRSGKPIADAKTVDGGDFYVVVPWAPAFDGSVFDDLCDDARRQVLRYLASIFQKSGKEDFAIVCRSAMSTSGGPLFDLGTVEAPEAPPEQPEDRDLPAPRALTEPDAKSLGLTMPVHADGTMVRSLGGVWYYAMSDAYHGPFRTEDAAHSAYREARNALYQDTAVDPRAAEVPDDVPGRSGIPNLHMEAEADHVVDVVGKPLTPETYREQLAAVDAPSIPNGTTEHRNEGGPGAGWYFMLDGEWRGPKKSESQARRAYENVLADRKDADERRRDAAARRVR